WRIGYVPMNREKEPFKLVKVRRAVAAALDPALIAPAVSPIGVPLLSFLPLGVWGRRDGPPVLEASSANAKRLLADAGLARGTSVSLLIGDDGKGGAQPRNAQALRAPL